MPELQMAVERNPPTLEERLGFSANLAGAGLSDLVQMQCLSGNRGVARVSSGDEVGYLYFRDGRVVHAMSASYIGEAAALEILAWSSGSFEPCNAGWPESESIQCTFQGLLLRAAQARDESGRHSLIRFPGVRAPSAVPPPSEPALATTETSVSVPPPESRRTPAPSGVTRVQAAVRIDEHGKPVTMKGSGAEALADSVALAAELAALIGDALGLDRLVAIEATSATQRTLMIVEKSGSMIGLRAPLDVDLTSVRDRSGI
jgi:hypothetical protein